MADSRHVVDAGNLISCTYVDFRDPAERSLITTVKKASSKRHAIPGCRFGGLASGNRVGGDVRTTMFGAD